MLGLIYSEPQCSTGGFTVLQTCRTHVHLNVKQLFQPRISLDRGHKLSLGLQIHNLGIGLAHPCLDNKTPKILNVSLNISNGMKLTSYNTFASFKLYFREVFKMLSRKTVILNNCFFPYILMVSAQMCKHVKLPN